MTSVCSACPHPRPWGCHRARPTSRSGWYLGLKGALQGPKGARVWEQGGQSWDGRGEGREKLQEKEGQRSRAPGGDAGPAPCPSGLPRHPGGSSSIGCGPGPAADRARWGGKRRDTHAGMSEVGAVQLGRVLVKLEGKTAEGEAFPPQAAALHGPAPTTHQARRGLGLLPAVLWPELAL